MKKLIALVLITLLALSMTPALAYELPLVTEPTTLTIMNCDIVNDGFNYVDNIFTIVYAVQADTGITIEWETAPAADYKTYMALRLASGEALPDIIRMEGDTAGAYLSQYYDEGILVDLKPLIEAYAPNLNKAYFEAYPNIAEDLSLPGGQIVALPSTNLSETSFKVIAIRQDWLDELELDNPRTPEDLANVAREFKTQDPNGNGEADEYGIVCGDMFSLKELGDVFGLSLCTGQGWVLGDDNIVCNDFTSETYKEFLKWMNALYSEGLIPNDFETSSGAEQSARLSANVAGIITRQTWGSGINGLNAGSIHEQIPESVWVPYVSDVLVTRKSDNTQKFTSYGITTDCKNPELAIQFLDCIIAGKFASGIEGVTYEVVDGISVNLSDWKERFEAVYGVTPDVNSNGSLPMFNWLTNAVTKWHSGIDAATIEILDTMDEELLTHVKLPFLPRVPSPEDAERVNDLLADMNTYRDEMFAKFVNGTADIDAEWNGYIDQMNTLGCQTICDIYSSYIK